MKKILILAYYYPPQENGAVGRFRSFYNHLNDFGYQPIIATVNNFGLSDSEKNIHRFDSLSTFMRKPLYKRFFYKRTKRIIDRIDPTLDFRWKNNVIKHFPDILRDHNISAIYCSFPPAASLVTGLELSKKYGIPLISEFRDGYVFEPIFNRNNRMSTRFTRRLEKQVVNNSKFIVCVTNVLTNYFRENYGITNVSTIFNGYEKSDFINLKIGRVPDNGKVKVVSFGAICRSRDRDVNCLFEALYNLKSDGIIGETSFELSLIGRYSQRERNHIDKYSLHDVVKIYDQMPKIEGFQKIVSEYDFLLLYGVPGAAHIITSKIFEYIYLNKPIIGICKGNEAANIIEETKTGEICDFITDEVYELFNKAVNNNISYNPDMDMIKKYDRRNQVKMLADLLDKYLN